MVYRSRSALWLWISLSISRICDGCRRLRDMTFGRRRATMRVDGETLTIPEYRPRGGVGGCGSGGCSYRAIKYFKILACNVPAHEWLGRCPSDSCNSSKRCRQSRKAGRQGDIGHSIVQSDLGAGVGPAAPNFAQGQSLKNS